LGFEISKQTKKEAPMFGAQFHLTGTKETESENQAQKKENT